MSRITQVIAKEVAIKMTSKKYEVIKPLQNELSSNLETFVKRRVPKVVLELYSKYPGYFNVTSSFRMIGNGFNHSRLHTNKDIPYVSNYVFEPTAEESEILLKLDNKIATLLQEKKDLIREIEITLYGLRTYAKVNSEFPEATPFLPKNVSNKLIVNINDIRNKLK